MTKQRILVVEDDAPIRRGIVDALEFDGYGVLEAGTASDGRATALDAAFDLLLLDLVLPDGQGFDYDGERYRSLSAIAKKVTGTHVNGFRFFGLQGKS